MRSGASMGGSMGLVLLLVTLSACGVIELDSGPDPLTVAEASEAQAGAAPVQGSLLETSSGEVRLCGALSDEVPPTCQGAYLIVAEHDVLPSHWDEAEELDGVRWVDDITLLGNVEGRMFVPVYTG